MNNLLSISDLLYLAKSTVELFLPSAFLEKNDCFETFSILADQGIAFQCYFSNEDANNLSEKPFLQAKIRVLATEGINFFIVNPVQAHPYYLLKDGSAYFEYAQDNVDLKQVPLDNQNPISKDENSSGNATELIPQKWPIIELSVDKKVLKVGDTTTLRWHAPAYDSIKCTAISRTDPVGEVVLEPQKSTVLIVDFIIGKRINRKVLAVEVIHEIAIEITVSVKNVLTNEFELLKAIDQQNPVYAIKRSTAVEVSWDVDFADQVLFSPFGKVEKCGTKRFILENPLDLCLSATLGSKTKEKKLLVNCYPTEVDASLINSIDAPSSFYPDLAQSAWSYVLDQKRQSFAVQSRQLEERINLMYQRLLQNKHELRLRLTKMNNHFQNNSKPKLSGESGVGHNKKYDYSSILRRFSKKEG